MASLKLKRAGDLTKVTTPCGRWRHALGLQPLAESLESKKLQSEVLRVSAKVPQLLLQSPRLWWQAG